MYGNLKFEICNIVIVSWRHKNSFENGVFIFSNSPPNSSLVSNKFSRFALNFSLKTWPRGISCLFPPSPENSTPFTLNLPMGAGATTPGAMEITGTLQQLVATFQQHGPSEELLPLMQRAMIALKVKLCERSYRCGTMGNCWVENGVRMVMKV